MDKNIPGTQIAARMFTQANGATMAEVIAATGGPQFNVLKRMEARGYRLRKIKEGKETRYYAEPPPEPSYKATVTSKGQITLPKEVRERLRLNAGSTVRFMLEEGDRVVVAHGGERLRDLFGILGKPPRSATLEQMDEAIKRGAVDRYLRAVGRKKR